MKEDPQESPKTPGLSDRVLESRAVKALLAFNRHQDIKRLFDDAGYQPTEC